MKMLTISLVLLFVSTTLADDLLMCPSNCTCKDTGIANCSNVDSVPNFEHKHLIHTLTINNHNITNLKVGDFDNFTHLEQLDLSSGQIRSIEAGTFDQIRTTVSRITLKANRLSKIDVGVFANLPVVKNIDLDSNSLQTVPANAFVNLTSLDTLTFRYNSIADVDQNAFIDLSQLEILNLYYNHLSMVPFEALAGLTTLKELTFTLNKISSIPENPGVFLPKLEDIHLDSNPLTLSVFPNISTSLKNLNVMFTDISTANRDTWRHLEDLDELLIGGTKFETIIAGTFEGLTNLKTLLIRDMPVLTTIGPDGFRGLDKVQKIDLAHNVKLFLIDETAFMSTNILYFSVQESSLSFIPENLFKWPAMKFVSISNNPINCDCKMKWILNSTIFGNNSNVKSSFDELTCSLPHALAGKKVVSVNPVYFTCVPLEDDHSRRFVTGMVVAVICFVFMVTFAMLMKNRKRISIACRRYYQYRRYKNDMVFTVEHDTSIAELEDTDGIEGRPLEDIKLVTRPLDA